MATILPLVALPPIQAAWACSLVSYDAGSGPLGSRLVRDQPDGRVLPSNALFLMSQDQTGELVLEDGTRVLLLPTTRPEPPARGSTFSPLGNVAGLTVEFESTTVTFSEVADTKPPTAG